jgi:hypothetical protein
MNDLFREKASKDLFHVTQAEAILAGDDPKSLREAKESPKWPEWECVAFKSLVRSGFFSFFGRTRTRTGPENFQFLGGLDWTNQDRSPSVLFHTVTSSDWSPFGPV